MVVGLGPVAFSSLSVALWEPLKPDSPGLPLNVISIGIAFLVSAFSPELPPREAGIAGMFRYAVTAIRSSGGVFKSP